MSDQPPLLIAQHVSKQFSLPGGRKLRAVDDASLTIERGGLVLFYGASGSGKSTLLGLLGGLARPTSGRIFFDQHELVSCSDMQLARLRRRMGFVFQNFRLLPQLPLWDGMTYGLIPRGHPRQARRATAAKLLDRLGLVDRIDQSPEQLSGGEQQRVALARALVGDPEVLFADEPTSNLDDQSAKIVLDLLCDLRREGRTLLVATHDPRFSLAATQRFELTHGRARVVEASPGKIN